MGILLHPNRCLPQHPSDEILEDYALSRLPEALAAPVEEHLLICHRCQDAVEAMDDFAAALKGAVRPPAWQRSVLPTVLRLSSGSLALAPAIILFLVVFLAVSNRAAQDPSV